jgi:hypothetical protein
MPVCAVGGWTTVTAVQAIWADRAIWTVQQIPAELLSAGHRSCGYTPGHKTSPPS